MADAVIEAGGLLSTEGPFADTLVPLRRSGAACRDATPTPLLAAHCPSILNAKSWLFPLPSTPALAYPEPQ